MIFRSIVLLSSMRPFDLLETIQRNTLVSSLDLQSSKLRKIFSIFVEGPYLRHLSAMSIIDRLIQGFLSVKAES